MGSEASYSHEAVLVPAIVSNRILILRWNTPGRGTMLAGFQWEMLSSFEISSFLAPSMLASIILCVGWLCLSVDFKGGLLHTLLVAHSSAHDCYVAHAYALDCPCILEVIDFM